MPTKSTGGAKEASTIGASTETGSSAATGSMDSGAGPRGAEPEPVDDNQGRDQVHAYEGQPTPASRVELASQRREAAAKLADDGYEVVRSGEINGENVLVARKDGELTQFSVGPQGGLHAASQVTV